MAKFSKKELVIFIGLILLGAVLRLYRLDAYPAGFHGDEGITGLEAKRIIEYGYIGFWSPGALGQAALPFYWTAIFFKIFGESINTARLSFALLTVFWIPFFYLLVRLISSKTTAVVATFLLITGSTPLAFSRRADFVAMSLSFFPAIFFFLLSLKTNKRIYFILAGIFIGLSYHMYASYWITPIILGVFTIYQILTLKKEFLRKYAKNFALLLVVYFCIASPMIIFAINHPNDIFSRSRMISIFSPQGANHARSYLGNNATTFDIFLHNAKATLGMFHLTNDPDSWNNFNNNPLFYPLTGTFFILGLIYCLRKFRDKQFFLIYSFFIIFLFGSIITIDAPNFRRAQPSIYIAYIFVGLGLSVVYDLFLRYFHRFKKIIFVSGVLIVSSIGAYNSWLYFTKYAASQEAKYILSYQLVQISKFLHTLPQDSYVYFYSNRWSYHYEAMRFLLPNIEGEDRSSQFGTYSITNISPKKTLVYLFLPDYADSLPLVQKKYPNGKAIVSKDEDSSILFYAYIIPKNL